MWKLHLKSRYRYNQLINMHNVLVSSSRVAHHRIVCFVKFSCRSSSEGLFSLVCLYTQNYISDGLLIRAWKTDKLFDDLVKRSAWFSIWTTFNISCNRYLLISLSINKKKKFLVSCITNILIVITSTFI